METNGTKHMPGPLTVRGHPRDNSGTAWREILAGGEFGPRYIGQALDVNAERLVACWNACDGFTTAQLESPEGVLVEPIRERDDLRAEVARLRAALAKLLASCDDETGPMHAPSWSDVCEAQRALEGRE